MIFVVATIELADGKRDEFLAHFRQLVPLVLEEDGCVEYGPAVDLETNLAAQLGPRPNCVTVMEKWQSLEHLEAHLVAPHMLEYRGKVKSLVQATQLQILEPA